MLFSFRSLLQPIYMPCWAASKKLRKTLEAAIQRRARREALPFLVLGLGNMVEDLEG